MTDASLIFKAVMFGDYLERKGCLVQCLQYFFRIGGSATHEVDAVFRAGIDVRVRH